MSLLMLRGLCGESFSSFHGRAKFKHALPRALHREARRQRRCTVEQQDHPVEFALAGPPRQRQPDGMKKFPAAVPQALFERRDNLLEPIRIDRRAFEHLMRQLADHLSRPFARQNRVAFGASQNGAGAPCSSGKAGFSQPRAQRMAAISAAVNWFVAAGADSAVFLGTMTGDPTAPAALWPGRMEVPALTDGFRVFQPATVAMTQAAMASPRPMASTPSFVLAFRLICSGVMPSVFARASRMAGKCGPSFGFSVITTASMCTMRSRRSSSSRCTPSRKIKLEAPFHLGSVSGKCMPISPRLAAPNNASQMACDSTSPSEWPSGPLSKGTSTPPKTNLRPPVSRCRSYPMPERVM